MRLPDRELINRIAQKDVEAFEMLYSRHGHAIRRHLSRMCRDAGAAEDLAQEVFLRVWTRANQEKGHATPKAWIFRIATNLMLNHIRSVRRRRERPLNILIDIGDNGEDESFAPDWMIDLSSRGPDAVFEELEQCELLWRFVDDLPEGKREAMHLVYDAEMEIREAAEALGIPEGTVKSRLHHARKQVAQDWRESEEG